MVSGLTPLSTMFQSVNLYLKNTIDAIYETKRSSNYIEF